VISGAGPRSLWLVNTLGGSRPDPFVRELAAARMLMRAAGERWSLGGLVTINLR
jgi:hypothetical protein